MDLHSDDSIQSSLLGAERTPIAAVPDGGSAKIVGRVRAGGGAELIAPISGRPCVYYEILIYWYPQRSVVGRWTRGRLYSSMSRAARPLAAGLSRPYRFRPRKLREKRGTWVEVEDDTGTAAVDLTQAEVTLFSKPLGNRVGVADDAVWQICAEIFERHGTSILRVKGPMRWMEWALLPGTEVAVFGRATRQVAESGSGGGYRSPPTRLCFRHDPRQPLVVCDDAVARQ